MFDEGAKKIKYEILIIEDSLFNQMVLRKILESRYTIVTSTTAEDAPAKVHIFELHLTLLDIILPDANESDILITLKQSEDTHNIPVTIITGLDDDEDEEEGFLLGAMNRIKWPFKSAIVLARVNTQIHIIRQIRAIKHLSLMDGLTGTTNRRVLDIQLQCEWNHAVCEHSRLNTITLDVDKFKGYNGTYRYRHGDFMPQVITQTLKQGLKFVADFFYRYGDGEFIILLPGLSARRARGPAQRLMTSVNQILLSAVKCQSSCAHSISLGPASMQSQPQQGLVALVERADKKLYLAKQNGRNQTQCEQGEVYERNLVCFFFYYSVSIFYFIELTYQPVEAYQKEDHHWAKVQSF